MADERVVATQLERIEQYHGEPKAKQRSLSREASLTDTTEQRPSSGRSKTIQECADLAKHVASTGFDFDGETSKEEIRTLGREVVIERETSETLVAAVGFRNVPARQYGDVDCREVYENLRTGLDVYGAFGQQLAQWTRERG